MSRQGEDELLRAVWQLLDETNEAIAAEEARAAQALIDFNTPILPLRPVL